MNRFKYVLSTLLITAGIFSVVSFNSCKKDEDPDLCRTVDCKNGGSCTDGSCSCPTYYEGKRCEYAWNDKFNYPWLATYWNADDTSEAIVTSKLNAVKLSTISPKALYFDDFLTQDQYDNVEMELVSSTEFNFRPNQDLDIFFNRLLDGGGKISDDGLKITGHFRYSYEDQNANTIVKNMIFELRRQYTQ